MRILILNWRDINNPLAGGAEISLFEHAKFWRKKGAEITWLSSSFLGAKKEEYIEGIKIIRRGSLFTVHLYAFLYFIRNLKNNTDIIIDNFHFIPFFSIFYKGKKIKTIAFIHEVATDIWFDNLSRPLAFIGYHLEPFFFKFYRNTIFITVSDSTKKELMEFSIPKKNIFVIHNGLRTPKLTLSNYQKDPVILFLGRISKDKGILDALKAFLIINSKCKESAMLVAGKEEGKDSFKKALDCLGGDFNIIKKIKYLGYVSEKVKFELLNKALIVIHPSKKEGWGLTVIESNSVGTPVVGYKVSGLKDSISHLNTGLLTDHNTPQDLADNVLSLINNKKLYDKLSVNATKWAKKFCWNKTGLESWKLLKNIYERDT